MHSIQILHPCGHTTAVQVTLSSATSFVTRIEENELILNEIIEGVSPHLTADTKIYLTIKSRAMSSQNIEERNYERLRSAVLTATSLTLPEYDHKNAKSIKKFLDDHANEYIHTGKALVQTQDKDAILKKMSVGPESEPLRKAIADIVKGFEHKSIHDISRDLKKLNNLVNA